MNLLSYILLVFVGVLSLAAIILLIVKKYKEKKVNKGLILDDSDNK